MSKGWIVGIIAGIVGIIAFFIPAYMITLSMEYMGNIINLFMTTWYWGFYMYSISGTISGSATGIQILTFMFIVGIVGIILSIIMIILGALSRSESKIPVLWIIFGIILIVLPLTELIFEYFGGRHGSRLTKKYGQLPWFRATVSGDGIAVKKSLVPNSFLSLLKPPILVV
ncbi:MAG: hypothetical protein P8Y70_18695 [Candidatus Lokiarchaeota archaeon]